MESLFGTFYTVFSVIVVYHMFVLQQWLEAVKKLETEAEELVIGSTVGSILRERIKQKSKLMIREYPYFQLILFVFSISILSYLIVNFSINELTSYSKLYTLIPCTLLVLIFILTSLFTWILGNKKVNKISNLF